MSASVINAAQFNATKLTVTAPKKVGDKGAKMSYLNYGEGKPLVIQTPSLPVPFGFGSYTDESSGKVSYSMNMQLSGYDSDPKVKQFYEAIQAIDEFMVEQGLKNSKEWFGKVCSKETIEDKYSPNIKIAKDKNGDPKPYPPSVKVAFNKLRDSDEFECKVFGVESKNDPNPKPITDVPFEELIPKRSQVTTLIQCTGVWFVNGKFNCKWKAIRVRLDSQPERISGYGFVDETNNDGSSSSNVVSTNNNTHHEEEFAPKPKKQLPIESDSEEDEAEAPPVKHTPVTQTIVDSDSDKEDDAEVAPQPIPKKPLKKPVKPISKK